LSQIEANLEVAKKIHAKSKPRSKFSRCEKKTDKEAQVLWRASLDKIIYLPNLGFALKIMILLWLPWSMPKTQTRNKK